MCSSDLGKRLLLAGNKSGMIHALDPDRDGMIVWERKVGRGGTSGGILWGPAADGEVIYAAVTDQVRLGSGREVDPNVGGSISAVTIANGEPLWRTLNPSCAHRKPCSPTQAAAVSAIPGVVFSGSNDGYLRAYAARDGKVIWEYDTVREFTTVNGVKAKGGSLNDGGAAIAGTPLGLVSALRKIEGASRAIPLDANPATAHMFIFPPMLGGLGRLFSTHPSMESRIANLEACRGQVA